MNQSRSDRTARLACLAVLGISLFALSWRAQAVSCAEEIDLLASQYALSTKLPESPSGMADEPATRQTPVTGSSHLPASKRRQMQVLLNGARAAHQQGKEAECLQRISEARAIPEPG